MDEAQNLRGCSLSSSVRIDWLELDGIDGELHSLSISTLFLTSDIGIFDSIGRTVPVPLGRPTVRRELHCYIRHMLK